MASHPADDPRGTLATIPGRFAGKVAMVTGGASGMGQAQSRRLAAEGAAVAIVDIDAEGGNAAVRASQADGGVAAFFKADVTDRADIEGALSSICREFGPPDLLFNNAGIVLVKEYDKTSEGEFDRMVGTNVRSAFMVTRRVIPEMLKHGGGSIVMMSSVSAMRGFALESIYGMTKAAVQSLMMNIAIEYRERGIRCNAVCPAFVRTPHGTREIQAFQSLGVAWDEQELARAQLRICEPADVASVALYLASDEARLLNGVAIPVDNGWMARA